jgi:AraC family transcriptional regulator, arabinose operon regulatory protein
MFRSEAFTKNKMSDSTKPTPRVASEWMDDVREVSRPVSTLRPLWVRHDIIESGKPLQPTAPYPERHSYCELSFIFSGENIQFVGPDQIERKAGDLLLMGPHTPHYAQFTQYPYRSVTVHFLPMVLCGMGPAGDGARLLARFTSPQEARQRAVTLPLEMQEKMKVRFEQMVAEVEHPRFGTQMRLLSLLILALVDLVRWEEDTGSGPPFSTAAVDWSKVENALRYIHEHHSENLYIEQIAKSVGLSVSMLQTHFRNAMGVSCVRYIRAYRIARATALLGQPDARVTEISMEVGFETLSHFNTSFRDLTGMSPTEYIRSCRSADAPAAEKPAPAKKAVMKPETGGRKRGGGR